MTGPEHYQEAEKKLHLAEDKVPGSDDERYYLAAAQVHATLAQAAAAIPPNDVVSNNRAWRGIAH